MTDTNQRRFATVVDLAQRAAQLVPLGRGERGLRGTIVRVGAADESIAGGLAIGELERRLLEIGFVEGAEVEILHEGLFGGDPIAVRLDDTRVALRRCEADAILVRVTADGNVPK